MAKALAALSFLVCVAGATDALPQTRSQNQPRASINSAEAVAIPRNAEPSCNVSREQVPRVDGRLEWRTRTDCTRDPY